MLSSWCPDSNFYLKQNSTRNSAQLLLNYLCLTNYINRASNKLPQIYHPIPLSRPLSEFWMNNSFSMGIDWIELFLIYGSVVILLNTYTLILWIPQTVAYLSCWHSAFWTWFTNSLWIDIFMSKNYAWLWNTLFFGLIWYQNQKIKLN